MPLSILMSHLWITEIKTLFVQWRRKKLPLLPVLAEHQTLGTIYITVSQKLK